MNKINNITIAATLATLIGAGCAGKYASQTASPTNTQSGHSTSTKTAPTPSLKNTFKDDFLIGTALNNFQVNAQDGKLADLIPAQFNAITAENAMKAQHLQPRWGEFRFEAADKLIDYAQQHQMKVNGHTLVWHSQMPSFARRIRNADSLRQFFTSHIATVAGHYKGKVYSWDVVNEALNEDGSLRKSPFLNLLGEQYLEEAFKLAQQADPGAELYYNDYNIEQPKKRAGAIALIKKLQASGARIDGVGIQGHWRINNLPLAEIEKSILAYHALGLKVMFTELDISVLPNPWDANTADVSNTSTTKKEGMNPYTAGLPDSVHTQLSQAYEQLFQLFLKHRDKITRITFWGVGDGQSWLNNFPIGGRTNYPLLFDRQNDPKPAFYAVIGAKNKL
ncbi:endo-1,4-beta-xylanase [Paraflavitalea pollutisoli]|uniref:endo-1,4-beta-xylanase n=1 Tax=Paraflavitalea pollutisoli TaxID=3034143 RepID=UPI0023ED6BAE|nr:endo-1,4-beta-xylanase [Paraflavitalea sp. H1-2-19X]